MKKLLVLAILFIAFTSCTADDGDSCNCTKSYFSFNNTNTATFVNSEDVGCTDEVDIEYIDSDTYYTIECQ